MNELKVINEQEVLGKQFKIYGDFENPFFLAKDVAEWIENSNASQMLQPVDDAEKALYTMYRVDGSTNKQWFLTEDGLYEVLMQSRKPIAKEFKKQVKQILKTIRKTGGYVNNSDLMVETYFGSLGETHKILIKGLLGEIEEKQRVIVEKDKMLTHKEDVIVGLVGDIDLATKRQRITQIVRYKSKNYSERYNLLYTEFEKKYHCDLNRRIETENNKCTIRPRIKNKMDYIDRKMNMIPQLYEIACKIFENDIDILKQEWDNVIV